MLFEAWLEEIDHELRVVHGISLEELPDYPWHDWYNNGSNPEAAIGGFFSCKEITREEIEAGSSIV